MVSSMARPAGKVTGIHTVNKRKVKIVAVATSALKVSVVGIDGTTTGNITLPIEVFGQKPNRNLIAQAVRVYLANQRQGNASTKTRGFVTGSARKVYRQKGTGRARHGSITGPIFVGGGIIFGPHPHDFSLKFPKKMKKQALISALSEKTQEGTIRVVDGEFTGKTKQVAQLVKSLELHKKGKADKILFIANSTGNATRAAHNLSGLTIESPATLSTYGVMVSKNIIFEKDAINEIAKRLTKKEN